MPPSPLARRLDALSNRLSRGVEHLCAALVVVLVLDVWLGILARRVLPFDITFTEELARYLMIWVALLAVSCGIAHREHIGIRLLYDLLPRALRRVVLGALDLLALAFFTLLFIYGLVLVEKGAGQFTMIFGLNRQWPFAAVPTAALLAMVQLVLVGLRDQLDFEHAPEPVIDSTGVPPA